MWGNSMSDANRRHGPCPGCQTTGGLLRKIARNETANVLPLVAVGTLVLAGLVGGGVDMARAYQAERRLQAACDAGVLAGRRAVTGNEFSDAAEAQAEQYFDANFDPAEQQTTGTSFTATSPDSGNTVEGVASATLGTIIMGVFGFESMDLSVTCSASMGVGNSDIMFVLDNTGSMAWTPDGDNTWDEEETRIFALRQAMMAFYDTVEASIGGGGARVRYGFVPYSSAVNVGALLTALNANFISDSITVQSRQPVNWGPVVETWTEEGEATEVDAGDFDRLDSYDRHATKSDCLDDSGIPADDTDWTAYGSPYVTTSNNFDPDREQMVTATGTHQNYRKADYECMYRDSGKKSSRGWYVYRRYYTRSITSYEYSARNPIPVTTTGASFSNWIYRPVEYDTSTFKTFVSTAAMVDSSWGGRTAADWETWDGCIQERQTTPASAISFVSLEEGIDPAAALDLDIDAAPTSDPATQWKPLWEAVAFRRGTLAASLNGSSSSADAGCPQQSQLLAEMDEDEFDDYVESLVATGSTYHDIGLLWGARLSSPTGIFSGNVTEEPDNGGTVSRHLIFMTDGELAPTLSINSSYGIESLDRRITGNGDSGDQWDNHRARYLAICAAIRARGIRLWVIAFGTDLSTDLQTCASPDSSFQANDADELNQSFQEIANQVGELRIVQ